MSTVRGCNVPEDRYYWVEKHVWVQPEEGGLVVIGMTDVAQNMASKLVAVTPKRLGRLLKTGKSVATVESGKWVGPVPTPVAGEIVEINQSLVSDPEIANRDPYGEGWIARLKPEDWEGEGAVLPTGTAAVEAYDAFLEQEGITCE